jgi:TolB-like protein/Flp pilus assembly protein TadD
LSLFTELKRRKVFRVAIAYIIAAWVVMQVADVILNNIAAPGWIFHVLLLLLSIGFPFAIIFAWAFELTPEGLKREQQASHAAVLEEATKPVAVEQAGSGREALVKPDKSIAVLPFVNMSEDSGNEYFSDGVSEELLNLLAKIPEMRVAAQTSSFSLKGKDLQISEVGEILKVAHVLEGSVRKAGNQVRITVQLIKANDGYHLWSETYDRTLDNIFTIHDEIATEVVKQLRVTLLGEAPTVRETDPAAYALFLQARQLSRQSTARAWEKSIALYLQTLDIAPDYAAAWTDLADLYARQTNKALRTTEEGFALALEAAEKALKIDPENAKAHACLGRIVLNLNGDLVKAAQHIETALSLEPANPDILLEAAILARCLGRVDESISLQEHLVILDPVNPIGHYRLGVTYLWALRLDAAIASLRTALSLSPERIAARWGIGIALLLKGESEAALAAIEQESDEGWRISGLVLAHHTLGHEAESNAALAEMIETLEQGAAYNIAYLLAFRGEADRAFEWLDKAVQYKDPGLSDLPIQPLFANIHSDPRWLPFLESVGKSPAQLDAIDFKAALPEHQGWCEVQPARR